MKVLLVISSLGAGGAERAMAELAAYLSDQGWEVTLATFEPAESRDFYSLPPGVRRVRLRNPEPGNRLWHKLAANIVRARVLRELVREVSPRLALSFMETSNVLSLLACRPLRVPVVVAERIDPGVNDTVPAAWRLARWLLYRRAAMVVAQTAGAAAWLRANCHCDPIVVPNALRKLPAAVQPREPIVLSVGRLDPQKGFDILLRAFALVQAEFPAWVLHIVGEGSLRGALGALARELGVADRLVWHPRTREIEHHYARAAVVAQASRFEGFPNVVLEAMGMGACVVCTDCRSGPSDLIQSGRNGWLVPVDNAPALAQALRTVMADPALRERLGHAATAVRETYRADAVHGRWQALLARAAGQPTP